MDILKTFDHNELLISCRRGIPIWSEICFQKYILIYFQVHKKDKDIFKKYPAPFSSIVSRFWEKTYCYLVHNGNSKCFVNLLMNTCPDCPIKMAVAIILNFHTTVLNVTFVRSYLHLKLLYWAFRMKLWMSVILFYYLFCNM